MPKLILSDVDGTIADNSHRQIYVANKPKNWKAYNENMHLDKPITDIIWLLQCLHDLGHKIIIVTAREEVHRETTIKWLDENGLRGCYSAVLMRPERDYRDDSIVKMEILQEIRKTYGEPDMVFDDRQKVVDSWRANGVRCLQVAPGNF